MRARAALAEFLLARGDFDAAIEHFRALLTLNPGDNQGLRYDWEDTPGALDWLRVETRNAR